MVPFFVPVSAAHRHNSPICRTFLSRVGCWTFLRADSPGDASEPPFSYNGTKANFGSAVGFLSLQPGRGGARPLRTEANILNLSSSNSFSLSLYIYIHIYIIISSPHKPRTTPQHQPDHNTLSIISPNNTRHVFAEHIMFAMNYIWHDESLKE